MLYKLVLIVQEKKKTVGLTLHGYTECAYPGPQPPEGGFLFQTTRM